MKWNTHQPNQPTNHAISPSLEAYDLFTTEMQWGFHSLC